MSFAHSRSDLLARNADLWAARRELWTRSSEQKGRNLELRARIAAPDSEIQARRLEAWSPELRTCSPELEARSKTCKLRAPISELSPFCPAFRAFCCELRVSGWKRANRKSLFPNRLPNFLALPFLLAGAILKGRANKQSFPFPLLSPCDPSRQPKVNSTERNARPRRLNPRTQRFPSYPLASTRKCGTFAV